MYQLWDLKKNYYEQTDEARLAAPLVYYCPTRRTGPQISETCDVPEYNYSAPHVPGAVGDYAGSAGDFDCLDLDGPTAKSKRHDFVHGQNLIRAPQHPTPMTTQQSWV